MASVPFAPIIHAGDIFGLDPNPVFRNWDIAAALISRGQL